MSTSFGVGKTPFQKTLYIAVPAVHFIIIAISFTSHLSVKKPLSKPIVIHTWTTPSLPAQQVKTTNVAPSALKQNKIATTPIEIKATKKVPIEPQKTIPQNKVKANGQTKAKTKQVPKTSSLSQKHLQEIEERIAKIEAKNDRMPIKSELAVPGTITLSSQGPPQKSLEFPNCQAFAMEDSVASIISYLQGFLQLPDIGEVQILLVLRKDGKVENVKVVKTESEENRKYLEKNLPEITFPPSMLKGLSSLSFLLAFCNK